MEKTLPIPVRCRAIPAWPLALLGALLALAIAGMAHIGYFGGDIFTDIPASAQPSPATRDTAAVLMSGDMGFRVGMGPKVAAMLAADGIPVVGVNSLTYYRQRRSPVETTALVEAAMRRALAFGKADRLVLIGQSFGADMLHVGLAALPPDLRARVRLVALVVPGDTVDYRASPNELFGFARPDADALPTARQLGWAPVICVRGAEETDSLCPILDLPRLRRVVLPGGHAMHHDAGAIHQAILSAIRDTGFRA